MTITYIVITVYFLYFVYTEICMTTFSDALIICFVYQFEVNTDFITAKGVHYLGNNFGYDKCTASSLVL